MQDFTFPGLPGRAVFGAGAIASLADEIDALGGVRALFCCTPGRAAMVAELAATVGERNAGVCARALPFTPMAAVVAARGEAREAGADCLVAFGGGNAVGLAKAIALDLDLPIVAVPTTYSGSETTGLQGIRDGEKRLQNASPRMLPRTVIYDPHLARDLPPEVSLPSGLNSIGHAVGAFLSASANPVGNLFAAEGIRVMAGALETLARDPADLAARGAAFHGAWLNGSTLALSGGVNVHHKICHVLGGGFGLAHAAVHTVVLPHSTAYNRTAVPAAMRAIADALGSGSGDAPGAIFDLLERVGAPTALRDIGMPRDGLDAALDQILLDAAYYSNPLPIEREPVAALLDAAWHGRRPAA